MEEQLIQLRSMAFFANQMLVCVVKNAIMNGVYDPATARTNIHETIDQATRTLSPEHHGYITQIAQAYNVAIDAAVEEMKRSTGG